MANRMKKYYHGLAAINPGDGGHGVEYFLANPPGGLEFVNAHSGDATNATALVKLSTMDYKFNGTVYQLAGSCTTWDLRGLTTLTRTATNTFAYVLLLADANGATTPGNEIVGDLAASTGAATPPGIPSGTVCMYYMAVDLSTLTTTESWTWDKSLATHCTFYQGYPMSAMYEDAE